MLSILKMLSIFSGSRGPNGPDLLSPFGRQFQLSVQADPQMQQASYNGWTMGKPSHYSTPLLTTTFYLR